MFEVDFFSMLIGMCCAYAIGLVCALMAYFDERVRYYRDLRKALNKDGQ